MSAILKKSILVELTNKDKEIYGIKIGSDIDYAMIELPVSFDDKELLQFSGEVGKLYDNSKAVASFGAIVVKATKGNFPFRKKAEYSMVSKNGKLNIRANRLKTSTFRPKPNDLALIDKCLRETILGKKLKEYWIVNEEISPEETQRRLEEITPAAGMF